MAGVAAFLFSTVVITLAAEIAPQAYFSRNALRMAALLSPVLRFYQVLLWPVARPSAKLLDAWVGPEGMPWYRERELRQVLEHHARGERTEIGRVDSGSVEAGAPGVAVRVRGRQGCGRDVMCSASRGS
jgi:metal transporter CNNM